MRTFGERLKARAPELGLTAQPSPHFSYSEINALPLNGQQAVTAISALWLRRSTAFRWLQQPIGRHLMIDVVEQVIERHQEVKNEGISEERAGRGVREVLNRHMGVPSPNPGNFGVCVISLGCLARIMHVISHFFVVLYEVSTSGRGLASPA